MKSLSLVTALLATGASAFWWTDTYGGMKVGPIDDDTDLEGLTLNGTNGWGTFDQLIDHANPKLGTFEQRFWYGTEYWKGPGSPIFLVNPGEQEATNFNKTYTTLLRLPGLMAKTTGGAVVVVEHRYWGQSSPFQELTAENLKYLTLENSLKDMTYFANNFDAPFDKSGKSTPKKAPWVFTGGSYPGAMAGWLAVKEAGTFWAYYGTSGVVETIGDFWQYFLPAMTMAPRNCSADVVAVIEYVDSVLIHGKQSEKDKLKEKFMLGGLQDADFASALGYGPGMVQSGQFYTLNATGSVPFFQWCDYVENVWPDSGNKIPGPRGVGLTKALDGYAKWFTEIILPGNCESTGYYTGTYNTECLQALNTSNLVYHDLTPQNAWNRQWQWMLCNEPFEWWQTSAPHSHPTFLSRLVTRAYYRSQCPLWFPTRTYGIAAGKSYNDVNRYTLGWNEPPALTKRLMFANGEWDPWIGATVSSPQRPGGPLKSTEATPVRVLRHGTHCSDLYGQNWAVNADAKAVADAEVKQMAGWVGEFYKQGGH